jgi:hypothetical protein
MINPYSDGHLISTGELRPQENGISYLRGTGTHIHRPAAVAMLFFLLLNSP